MEPRLNPLRSSLREFNRAPIAGSSLSFDRQVKSFKPQVTSIKIENGNQKTEKRPQLNPLRGAPPEQFNGESAEMME